MKVEVEVVSKEVVKSNPFKLGQLLALLMEKKKKKKKHMIGLPPCFLLGIDSQQSYSK